MTAWCLSLLAAGIYGAAARASRPYLLTIGGLSVITLAVLIMRW